mmetsp:Transcript_83973/g.186422  ORF Transcript_83973/g.186422 Transcript_83973/m.186422 type:complete len:221 (+) Transcript_83973:459-1121(+)
MEALEKGIDLLPDRVRHLMLRHELDVLVLVIIVDGEAPPVGLQVHNLLLPEIVALCGEGQLHDIRDVVIQHPLQVREVFWIERFQIRRNDLSPEHVLVEAAREPRLQVVAIVDRFADHATDKLKELEVVPVDIRHWVRMVGASLASGLHKECVVRVEDLFGQSTVPLLPDAPSVNALLALELDLNLRPHLLASSYAQLVVGVHENLVASHTQADGLVTAL